MENLNAEQVKKALVCCAVWGDCKNCPYGSTPYKSETDNCTHNSTQDALALINSQEQRIGAQDMTISELRQRAEKAEHDADRYAQKIKELTDENERVRAENENKCKDCAGCIADKCDCANIEAYAVEKYKSAIIEYYSKPKYQPTKEHPIKHTQIEHLFAVLDQIAKEMLEGKDDNT